MDNQNIRVEFAALGERVPLDVDVAKRIPQVRGDHLVYVMELAPALRIPAAGLVTVGTGPAGDETRFALSCAYALAGEGEWVQIGGAQGAMAIQLKVRRDGDSLEVTKFVLRQRRVGGENAAVAAALADNQKALLV